MIKDVFIFKKNSWHVKLMNWTWGFKHYDFRNMCPYFWLSVFNIFLGWYTVLPVRQFGKLVMSIISYFQDKMNEYEQDCQRKDEEYRNQLREQLREIALDPKKAEGTIWEDYFLYNKAPEGVSHKKLGSSVLKAIHSSRYMHEFDIVFDHFESKWNSIFQQKEKENREKEDKKEAIVHIVKAETSKKIAKITNTTKSITGVLMYGIGGLLAYFCVWLASKMYKISFDINWVIILEVAIVIFLILLCIGIGILIVKSIQFLWCRYGKYCIPCEERREAIGNFLLIILAIIIFPFINVFGEIRADGKPKPGFLIIPFIWLWKGIVLLWELLIAMKAENCPGLEWKD